MSANTRWKPIGKCPLNTPILVYGGVWESEVNNPKPNDVAYVLTSNRVEFHELGGAFYASWVTGPTLFFRPPATPVQP